MFIEVLHDAKGKILSCFCADTLPEAPGEPLFRAKSELPAGVEQARINIDTVTAMEIDQACGPRPVIDAASGALSISDVHRPQYVIERFLVDTSNEICAPAGVSVPQGIRLRGLLRKQ